jgi:hypothetical protein
MLSLFPRWSLPAGARIVPQPCIRWVCKYPNHDAVIRIGDEAPGGAPILFPGTKAMEGLRVTPPRIGARRAGSRGRAGMLTIDRRSEYLAAYAAA